MKLLVAAVVTAVWLAPLAPAAAAPDEATIKVAREHYEKGNAAYNLGRFDEAVGHFTKAYEVWPNPDFLYNIAQSYRLAGNCKQALFVYKRYLSLKSKDKESPLTKKEKSEIERFIKELTACAAKADSSAARPPDTLKGPTGGTGGTTTTTPTGPTTTTTGPTTTPTGPTTTTTPTGPTTTTTTTPTTGTTPTTTGTTTAAVTDDDDDDVDDDATTVTTATEVAPPRVVSARLTGGIAMFGAGELDVPMQAGFGIGAGYPLALGKITLDLGARASYSPIKYDTMTETKSASLIGARATVGVSYNVHPKVALRGDLGVGIVHLGGLAEGNPFTDTREPGSFTMLSVRVGAAVEYFITPNVMATLQPFAFAYSPVPDDLFMSSLTEIDVALGVGYRM